MSSSLFSSDEGTFINHYIKCEIEFNLPSLFAAGVDDVKGNPFGESLLLCAVFWRFCAGLKPRLLCNVLVKEGWREEKSEFMKPTFMSRTCILIFSSTSLCCWKLWSPWTPAMFKAERLLSIPNAWFDGNCESLQYQVKRLARSVAYGSFDNLTSTFLCFCWGFDCWNPSRVFRSH